MTAALAPRTVQVRRRRLHPGQLRLKRSKARFRVAMFGRRWGKNCAGVDEAMEDALAGKRVGWFEPNYKYFTESWRDICSRLTPVTKHKDDDEKRLELITGGIIEGWTCDSQNPGRSRAYHKVIINEAGIIPHLRAIWQESIRPTLTDYQGSALFLGTPKGRTHDFSTLHAQAAGLEGWDAFRGPTSENPWIPKDEIEAARRELPAAIFAQEYEGIPADDGGNPFGLDAILKAVMSAEEWKLAQQAETIARGWDFGRAQDYTVGCGLGRKYQVTALDRWYLKPWNVTYTEVTKLTGAVPAWGDSTGIGDVIVESLQMQGCPIQGYHFSRPSKQLLMQRLASVLQTGRLRIPPRDANPLVAELETFGYEYTASGVRYTAPEGMHDDCVMALALAVYGRDQFGELPEPKGVRLTGDDDHPGMQEGRRVRKRQEQAPTRPSFVPRGRLVPVE